MFKKKRYIVIIIIVIILLLFPRKYYIKDGGSCMYESILYSVTVWNGIMIDGRSTGVTINLFDKYEIYNSFSVVPDNSIEGDK